MPLALPQVLIMPTNPHSTSSTVKLICGAAASLSLSEGDEACEGPNGESGVLRRRALSFYPRAFQAATGSVADSATFCSIEQHVTENQLLPPSTSNPPVMTATPLALPDIIGNVPSLSGSTLTTISTKTPQSPYNPNALTPDQLSKLHQALQPSTENSEAAGVQINPAPVPSKPTQKINFAAISQSNALSGGSAIGRGSQIAGTSVVVNSPATDSQGGAIPGKSGNTSPNNRPTAEDHAVVQPPSNSQPASNDQSASIKQPIPADVATPAMGDQGPSLAATSQGSNVLAGINPPSSGSSLPGSDLNGTPPGEAVPLSSNAAHVATAVVMSSTNAAGSVIAVSTTVPSNFDSNPKNGLQNPVNGVASAVILLSTNTAGLIVTVSNVLPITSDTPGSSIPKVVISAEVISSTDAAGSILDVSTTLPNSNGVLENGVQSAANTATSPTTVLSTNTQGQSAANATLTPIVVSRTNAAGSIAMSTFFLQSITSAVPPVLASGASVSTAFSGSGNATVLIAAGSSSPTGGTGPGNGPLPHASGVSHHSNKGTGQLELFGGWRGTLICTILTVSASLFL